MTGFSVDENKITAVHTLHEKLMFDAVIIATGGLSYPATGSSGDGYIFAKEFGHTVTELRPSLVSLQTDLSNIDGLQGLTLKNVEVKALQGDKIIASEFGELLFTHQGISGPTVLTISSKINHIDTTKLIISIDLKPALDVVTLDARLLRDFQKYSNKMLKNSLDELLPKALIPKVIACSNISEDKEVNSITAKERSALLHVIKNFRIQLKALGGYHEAVVTSGGVDVKEVDPKTMKSKLIQNLYLCGEILDLDALTGGFNLQIALSTGYVAGNACAD